MTEYLSTIFFSVRYLFDTIIRSLEALVVSVSFTSCVADLSQAAAGAAKWGCSHCRTESESEGVALLGGGGTKRTDHCLWTRQRYREQFHWGQSCVAEREAFCKEPGVFLLLSQVTTEDYLNQLWCSWSTKLLMTFHLGHRICGEVEPWAGLWERRQYSGSSVTDPAFGEREHRLSSSSWGCYGAIQAASKTQF